MKKIFLVFISLLIMSLSFGQEIKVEEKYANTARKLNTQQVLQTIAFGSCNNQNKSQEMWKYVVKSKPELWIWLGDNIYADTKDPSVMAKKYTRLKNNINYRRLLACAMVVGTWDDHDFGQNDAGKDFSAKNVSKRLLLDFLDVPKKASVRNRKGVYQSYTFGEEGKKVKVLLLDSRYFRDDLTRVKSLTKKYGANMNGKILGTEQWTWLEKELTDSDAQIHLICSGFQIIAEEHGFEKWANFPKERERLFQLLQKTNPNFPILLSGDRHIAEVAKIELEEIENPIYEITSSGLTHSWSSEREEPNQYRVGDLVINKNFAVMKIDWSEATPKVKVEVRGLENELFLTEDLN